MRLSEGERVHGPYAHRTRWRLIIKSHDGKQRYLAFESEAEAEQCKAELSQDCEPRTIDEAVTAYLAHLRDTGVNAISVKCYEAALSTAIGAA